MKWKNTGELLVVAVFAATM